VVFWFEVAAEDAKDITKQVGQHQARPQSGKFDLNVFHDLIPFYIVITILP
jgi:hypothetical protein